MPDNDEKSWLFIVTVILIATNGSFYKVTGVS